MKISCAPSARRTAASRSVAGVAGRLMRRTHAPADESLTERELDVLRLVASGATNREIAKQLFISETTVKTHLLHLYAKLAVPRAAVGYPALGPVSHGVAQRVRHRLLLLGRQRLTAAPVLDALGVQPRLRPTIDRRQHQAVAEVVEQRGGEGQPPVLIAERVVADDGHVLQRLGKFGAGGHDVVPYPGYVGAQPLDLGDLARHDRDERLGLVVPALQHRVVAPQSAQSPVRKEREQ